MEQVVKLYVYDLTTLKDRETLYICQYFFNEGEFVAICEDCLNFFKKLFFPSCFCFEELGKCSIEKFMILNEKLFLPTEFEQLTD